MKIPDLIYANNSGVYAELPVFPHENIEYIRKDTLLEWLKEMKRICRGAEPIEKAYQTILDKLNSM